MMERCNFCWAKLSDGSCFCPKENRAEHCRKAKQRCMEQKKKDEEENTRNKIKGLRNYLAYIPKRLGYLRADNAQTSNEWKYYAALYEEIKRWGKLHRVFFRYLIKQIKLEEAKRLLGLSERQTYRVIDRQKQDLMDFITEQEKLLQEKYPFENEENYNE